MSATSSSFRAATGSSPRVAEFDLLFQEMCGQLREKASHLCRSEASPLVSTGDLLNDLYLKLRKHPTYSVVIGRRSSKEFVWMATQAMRNVLTDAARSRPQLFQFVPLAESDQGAPVKLTPEQLIDLDAAFTALEREHPRQAAMIMMRFYGGLSIQELHGTWAVADATVSRDLALSLKFLNRLLSHTKR